MPPQQNVTPARPRAPIRALSCLGGCPICRSTARTCHRDAWLRTPTPSTKTADSCEWSCWVRLTPKWLRDNGKASVAYSCFFSVLPSHDPPLRVSKYKHTATEAQEFFLQLPVTFDLTNVFTKEADFSLLLTDAQILLPAPAVDHSLENLLLLSLLHAASLGELITSALYCTRGSLWAGQKHSQPTLPVKNIHSFLNNECTSELWVVLSSNELSFHYCKEWKRNRSQWYHMKSERNKCAKPHTKERLGNPRKITSRVK